MASRIMHLAISKQLEKYIEVKDIDRFRIGQILPDAVISNQEVPFNSHYRKSVCNNSKMIMDFSSYFRDYEREIHEDSLYLGYYFHLIEDVIFRNFMYYNLKLISRRGTPQLIGELYQDYHILNYYLIQKYLITPIKHPTKNFKEEYINQICPFDLESFLANMQSDFIEHIIEKPKHFTEDFAERYIEQCREYCLKEYNAILKGKHAFTPIDFAWDKK